MKDSRKTRETLIKEASDLFNISNNFFKRITENPFASGGVSVEFFETSKFILLCTQKGGSSYINTALTENNLIIHNPDEVRPIFDKFNNFIDSLHLDYENMDIPEVALEYTKILQGKSKKDLIIVTRNPILKWMSGVVQDLDILLRDAPVLRKLINYEVDYIDYEQSTLNLQKELLIDFLIERFESEGTTACAHSQLYNDVFYQLLSVNSNIDKNKLYLVDIDNPNHNLADVLKRYHPEIPETETHKSYWTHRHKHDYLFSDFEGRIDERQLEILLTNSIIKDITYDYQWYLILLANYKDNLWKK